MVSPVNAVQRETAVLDLYLAAKVHEDVWADDTELHLEVNCPRYFLKFNL